MSQKVNRVICGIYYTTGMQKQNAKDGELLSTNRQVTLCGDLLCIMLILVNNI